MAGSYSGNQFPNTAIAADNSEFLIAAQPLQLLTGEQALKAEKTLKTLPKNKLDHMQRLDIFSVVIEGRTFLILSRRYQPSRPDYDQYMQLFAIGELIDGAFHATVWRPNNNTRADIDEQEYPVGVIHDKTGHTFLIDTVSDPETQHFRVYGLRGGKLVVVFDSATWGC